MIEKRDQVAKNAGFDNYRDYKFVELGRFDYTKEDCFQFHEAVKLHVLPLVKKINDNKKEKLGLDVLRPWDTEAEPEGVEPLHPFETVKNCWIKPKNVLTSLNPFFADCLKKMNALRPFGFGKQKRQSAGRL